MITNAERAAMRARYENRSNATTSDIADMVCEDVPVLLDALDEMERERDAALAAARLDGARAMQEAAIGKCDRMDTRTVAAIRALDPATVGTVEIAPGCGALAPSRIGPCVRHVNGCHEARDADGFVGTWPIVTTGTR